MLEKNANVNKFKFCAIYSIGNLNNIKKNTTKKLKKINNKKILKRIGLEFIRLSNKWIKKPCDNSIRLRWSRRKKNKEKSWWVLGWNWNKLI